MAEPGAESTTTTTTSSTSSTELLGSFISEIISSPVNLALVAIIAILVYKIFRSKTKPDELVLRVKELPKMRRDFTIEELKEYNGVDGPDGRILVAVNGQVFDVTKGARFYGPGKKFATWSVGLLLLEFNGLCPVT